MRCARWRGTSQHINVGILNIFSPNSFAYANVIVAKWCASNKRKKPLSTSTNLWPQQWLFNMICLRNNYERRLRERLRSHKPLKFNYSLAIIIIIVILFWIIFINLTSLTHHGQFHTSQHLLANIYNSNYIADSSAVRVAWIYVCEVRNFEYRANSIFNYIFHETLRSESETISLWVSSSSCIQVN